MRYWHQFRRNRLGPIGLVMLAVAVLVALAAPLIAPYDPYASVRVTVEDIFAPPSSAHLLGNDDAGKDVLSALVYGTRVSLLVGFSAALISLLVGGLVGLVAGYRGGRLGNGLMRFTDFFLVIPDLALQIVIVAIIGQSLRNIILVIGLLGWTTTARLVRAQTLSVKERAFIRRAKAIGASDLHIVARHVFPQVLPLMLANTVLVISLAILSESTLAFIGLGDPTVISWGQMLNFAFTRGAVSAGAWWALVPPGLAIVWAVLGTTFVGNALEDTFNPRLGAHHLERRKKVVPGAAVSPARFDPEVAVSLRNLSVIFEVEDSELVAVDDVSFDIRKGQAVGLVGESGCGKTTTMLAALRLLPPGGRIRAGEIRYGHHDLARIDEEPLRHLRWNELAMVFQGAMNALNPVKTIGWQIIEAIRLHITDDSEEARRRARRLLEVVGIPPNRVDAFPHQLSGGMRQRAMIALALAADPQLIVADEPTTALDVMVQAQVMDLIRSIQHQMGMAMVLITHDLGLVAESCQRVVVMYGGVIAEQGTVDQVFHHPQHPYTKLLLEAFPDLDRPERPLVAIPGSPPRLDQLPPGCRFAPRCPSAFDRCHRERPPAYPIGPDWEATCFLLDPEVTSVASTQEGFDG